MILKTSKKSKQVSKTPNDFHKIPLRSREPQKF